MEQLNNEITKPKIDNNKNLFSHIYLYIQPESTQSSRPRPGA